MTQSSSSIELSIILPCLNEAKTVGRCVEEALLGLREQGVSGEVIVVDNGSTDGSAAIAKEKSARVIRAPTQGYGAAIRAGVAAAQGTYILMADADDSYDVRSTGPFLARLHSGDDLVMGNRFRGGIEPGAMPWHHRRIGNPLLTGILNVFFHSGIGDAHCGIRAFRKAAFQKWDLTTTGMEFASEMVVKARLHGDRISEVPVRLRCDGRDRSPHLRSFRDGWRHLRFLLLLCPLWLYLLPAGGLLGVGAFLMVWLTPGPRMLGSLELDVHTMLLGALCMLLGYQTLWLWAYSKIFGWKTGLLPIVPNARRVFQRLTLERCVLAGSLLLLIGFAFNIWLVQAWAERDFGSLEARETLRSALWGFLLLILGVQTIYGGFFLGMLGLTPRSLHPPQNHREDGPR